MKTFVIDSTNCAKAYLAAETARKSSSGTRFTTEKELRSVSRDWPLSRLVAIWNQLPGTLLADLTELGYGESGGNTITRQV